MGTKAPQPMSEPAHEDTWVDSRERGRARRREFLTNPLAVSILATLPEGDGSGGGLRVNVADLVETAYECDGIETSEEEVRRLLRDARAAGFPVDLTPTRLSARAVWTAHHQAIIGEAFDRLLVR